MNIDPATGLLENTSCLPSPNMDERPEGAAIDLIVVHSISLPPGEFGGDWIGKFFCNELPADAHPYFEHIHAQRVSAHALILRDGSVVQFVPFHMRAWHAGESCFRGRERCNDFSIGIELEGTDTLEFEDAQYAALAELIRALRYRYPDLRSGQVAGHSEISPGRKTDPGTGFDWARLKSLLA